MSNRIIFELAQEDRNRLDGITCLLAALIDHLPKHIDVPSSDPLHAKLTAIVENAVGAQAPAEENTPEERAETAQDEEEPVTPTDTPPKDEKPATANHAPTEEEIAEGRARIRAKFIELSAKGKRDDAKALIQEYAESIPAVPADKLTECYEKLCALEG